MTDYRWIRCAAALLAAGGLCLSLATGASHAAPDKSGQRPAKAERTQRKGQMAAALERLNLSAEQKRKIAAIRARQRAEVQALRQGSGDREARQGRRRELRSRYRAELMAVLTAEQRQQLKAEVKKARPARRTATKA